MLLVIFTQFCAGLYVLAITKLLSVYLLKSVFGQYALASSLVFLLLSLPFNSFNMGALRFSSRVSKRHTTKANYLTSMVSLYGIFLVIQLLVLILFWLNSASSFWKSVIPALFIYTVSRVLVTFLLNFYSGSRQRYMACKLSVVSLLCGVVSLWGYLGEAGRPSLSMVFYILAVSNFLSVFLCDGIGLFRVILVSPVVRKKYWMRSANFSMPLLAISWFVWFRSMASRWFLSWFVTKQAVATFSILSSLAIMLPMFAMGVLGSYFAPICYQNEPTQRGFTRRLVKKASLIALFSSIIFLVFLYLFKIWIVILFSSEKYVGYAWMLPAMIFSYSMFAISQFSSIVAQAEMRTNKLLLPNLFIDVLSLLIGYFAVKYHGLFGAYCVFNFTYIMLAIVIYVVNMFDFTVYGFMRYEK